MDEFKWRKLGLVFSPQQHGLTWMSEFAQAPAALILDDRVRVYFATRPPADRSGNRISRLGFVEFAIIHDHFEILNVSTQPIIDLGRLGEFDEFGTYPVSVVDMGSRLFAYYGGWTRCWSVPFDVSIGLATSEDGKYFAKSGPGPVLTASMDEPFVISGPKIRRFGDLLYLFYIAGKKWEVLQGRPEVDYRIRLATSTDGISWAKRGVDLIPPIDDSDEAQASPDVTYANGVYHMFFCYRKKINFRGLEGSYRLGYAKSTDLVTWERCDSRVGLAVSENGFDSDMVSYPNVFCWRGRYFMLYLGNGFGLHGFGAAVLESPLQ